MDQRIFILRILMMAALAACLAPRAAEAELAHRYSFTSNANDSIGGANGTVVDAGFNPNFMFADGQLDLSANIGEGSNGITEDAYVDLPNGLMTDVATSGTSGAFSMELWATVSETHTWQRFVDVGSSNDGEDTSNGGGTQPYIYIAANSGRFGDGISSEAHAPDQAGAATEAGQAGPLENGVQVHVVGTYDQADTSAGANGTLKLYRDGAFIGQAAIPDGLDLNTFTNNNNWLGRSQWGDPLFDGSYNEFRIYDHALSASEAATNFIFGPDELATQLLSLSVNTTTGEVTMTNNASIALNADFYRISSPTSALSQGGWNSLDAQDYDAVDGTDGGTVAGDSDGEGWDEAGGSDATQLVEEFLGEAGSMIGPGETLNLGNAFDTSKFGVGNDGDLEFSFGLIGGLQLVGDVSYTPGTLVPGDYDNSGQVAQGDLDLVLLNWGKTVPPDPVPEGWINEQPSGLIGQGALDGVLLNWGNTAASGSVSGAAVPEPAAFITILIAAAALGARRRAASSGF